MNQFIVPQFINVEAKIIGPVSVRQFIISLIGGFALVIAYKFADTALFIIEFLIIATVVTLFGFIKVNGRPFHLFLQNFFETLARPSVRVWQPFSDDTKVKPHEIEITTKLADSGHKTVQESRLTPSRLQSLSLVVDTGGVYRTES